MTRAGRRSRRRWEGTACCALPRSRPREGLRLLCEEPIRGLFARAWGVGSPLIGEGQGEGDSPAPPDREWSGHWALRSSEESSREGRSPFLENDLPGRAGGTETLHFLSSASGDGSSPPAIVGAVSRKPVDHALPRMRLPHATDGPLLDLRRLRLLHLRPRGPATSPSAPFLLATRLQVACWSGEWPEYAG